MELGTAVYNIVANLDGLNRGVAQAKQAVRSLESDTSGLDQAARQGTISVDQMMANFKSGMYEGKAAAGEATAATEQLAGGLGVASKAAVGLAVAFAAFQAGKYFLEFMAENSPEVAQGMSELGKEVDDAKKRIAEGLTPAALAMIAAFSAGIEGVGNFFEAVADGADKAGDAIDSAMDALEGFLDLMGALSGGNNADWKAVGGLFGLNEGAPAVDYAKHGWSTLIPDVVRYQHAVEDASDEQVHAGRSMTTVWEDVQGEIDRTIEASKELHEANLRHILDGQQMEEANGPRGHLPTVYPGAPPAQWIGQVKGVYSSIADFVSAKMAAALFPSQQEETTYSWEAERAKATLARLAVLQREQPGGLTQNQRDIRQAQQRLLRQLIGGPAAADFIGELLAAPEKLIGGKLGKAMFEAGRQAADQLWKGLSSTNVPAAIEANDPTEQIKTGMEQVTSAQKLEIPGLVDAMANVEQLGTDLTGIGSINVSPVIGTGFLDAAIAKASMLLSLLAAIPFVGGGGGGGSGGSSGGGGGGEHGSGASQRDMQRIAPVLARAADGYNRRRNR